jgi:hypothetical protein
LLFAHQPHGFIAELIGVIDGSYTGLRGVKGARLARGVNGDALSDARSFSDGSAEFGLGVLIGCRELPVLKTVFAGFVDLDEIGALFDLLANRGYEFGGTIGIRRVRENMLLRVVAEGIFVAAQDGNGLPLMRNRGPGIRPWSMALRTAVSAEPAPSVPISRSAVYPAMRSARAATVAMMVRCGTDS